MPASVLLLVLDKKQETWKTILVDKQNFTINLITELLTYVVSSLQRVAYWVKALQLNQKVLCLKPINLLPGLVTRPFHKVPGDPQAKNW